MALLSSGGPRGTLTPRGHSHVTGSASMVLLEQQTSRPHTTPCQVPNVTGVTLKGTSGGTSAMAWSHDGRWLAVAAADAAGGTRVSGGHDQPCGPMLDCLSITGRESCTQIWAHGAGGMHWMVIQLGQSQPNRQVLISDACLPAQMSPNLAYTADAILVLSCPFAGVCLPCTGR